MARTKRSRRSYGAGEWGRNRVRVFPDPKTGLYQMEWRENGRRLTRSLRHRDWMRAKREADEFAADFVGPDLNGKADAEPEPLTLGTLFDIYGEEVTPAKAERVQRRDRVATGMFLDFLGRDRRPETLSQRDWDRFIRERRAGTVGPSGKPVGDRTVEWDLTFLMAVLNWAARSKDEQGRPLLDRNPLKGLKKPREKNPTRVVLTEEEYEALLDVSRQVGWRFHVALVLAHETGHRIGAIRNLRWSDIDLEGGMVRWRAQHEKTGYEHATPLTDDAIAVLEVARRMSGGSGPVLPVPGHPSRCPGRDLAEMVVQGRDPRRARTEAWPRLALAAAQVRQRPDGPAAQGALRAWRMEEPADGPDLLPAREHGTTQEGSGRPQKGSQLRSQLAGINWRESNRRDSQVPRAQQDAFSTAHAEEAVARRGADRRAGEAPQSCVLCVCGWRRHVRGEGAPRAGGRGGADEGGGGSVGCAVPARGRCPGRGGKWKECQTRGRRRAPGAEAASGGCRGAAGGAGAGGGVRWRRARRRDARLTPRRVRHPRRALPGHGPLRRCDAGGGRRTRALGSGRDSRFRGDVAAHGVRCRGGGDGPREGRLDAERGAADAHDSAAHPAGAGGAGPGMPLPRVWVQVHRGASHEALGGWGRNEPPEHAAVLSGSPSRRSRGTDQGVCERRRDGAVLHAEGKMLVDAPKRLERADAPKRRGCADTRKQRGAPSTREHTMLSNGAALYRDSDIPWAIEASAREAVEESLG